MAYTNGITPLIINYSFINTSALEIFPPNKFWLDLLTNLSSPFQLLESCKWI